MRPSTDSRLARFASAAYSPHDTHDRRISHVLGPCCCHMRAVTAQPGQSERCARSLQPKIDSLIPRNQLQGGSTCHVRTRHRSVQQIDSRRQNHRRRDPRCCAQGGPRFQRDIGRWTNPTDGVDHDGVCELCRGRSRGKHHWFPAPDSVFVHAIRARGSATIALAVETLDRSEIVDRRDRTCLRRESVDLCARVASRNFHVRRSGGNLALVANSAIFPKQDQLASGAPPSGLPRLRMRT